jgi:hypothetical protein
MGFYRSILLGGSTHEEARSTSRVAVRYYLHVTNRM